MNFKKYKESNVEKPVICDFSFLSASIFMHKKIDDFESLSMFYSVSRGFSDQSEQLFMWGCESTCYASRGNLIDWLAPVD